jgi:hypothetical protein
MLELARLVHHSMSLEPTLFSTILLLLPLKQFGADVAALETAQAASLMRGKVAFDVRDAALFKVIADLDLLCACVQWLVDMDPANGPTLAEKAGMTTTGKRMVALNSLRAKKSKTRPHGIDVFARKTANHEQHDWAYSIDGGRTWIPRPASLQTRITLGPFTPGLTVLIRHRSTTASGPGNWSDPISFIVT